MRAHPLFFFFFFAFAISWVFLTAEVLSVWGYLPNDSNFVLTVNVFFTFGPTLAAITMVASIEGKAGLLRLRSRIWQWREGWKWYLFILAGIPSILILGSIIQPGVLGSFQGLAPVLLVTYPAYFFITFFGGGPLGEEIGWRGYALPRMQPRYGPLIGTFMLGVVWASWHLPQFLTPYQGGGPGTGWLTFLTNFPLFFGMVVSLAIVITWVFNHTHGSIFTSILVHTSVDTPQNTLFPLFVAITTTIMLEAGLIGFGVTALLIVILTRGKLGYKPGEVLKPEDKEVSHRRPHLMDYVLKD